MSCDLRLQHHGNWLQIACKFRTFTLEIRHFASLGKVCTSVDRTRPPVGHQMSFKRIETKGIPVLRLPSTASCMLGKTCQTVSRAVQFNTTAEFPGRSSHTHSAQWGILHHQVN